MPECVEEDGVGVGRPEEAAVLGVAFAEHLDTADVAKRVAAAERDQGGGAVGECGQGLGRVLRWMGRRP